MAISNLRRWFVEESHDIDHYREYFSSLESATARAREKSSECDGEWDVVDTLGRHAAIVESSWVAGKQLTA